MDAPNTTPLPPAIPITHQSHPFWHFNWSVALQVLQAAAVVAPVVVAITDGQNPEDVLKAEKLGGLAGGVLSGLSHPSGTA